MTRTPRSPRTVALLDQYEAADRDACMQISALAEHLSGCIMPASTSEPIRLIIRKFVTQLVTSGVTLCPHLSQDAPSPVHWAPWAPGRLRCAHCHNAAGARFQDTKKCSKCDTCGIDRGEALHAVLTSTPPVAVTASDGGDPWIVPPTLITYSVCGNCAATEQRGQHG
jgi:hypothetical protein